MCNRPEEEDEDDKLYCLCQQKYVEGEVMLACEKCDEWYHPKCLGISEEEADKLDNWMCSRFFPLHPFSSHLPLNIVWKFLSFPAL